MVVASLPKTGTIGQTVTFNGYNYRWTGTGWKNIGVASVVVGNTIIGSNTITSNNITISNTVTINNNVTVGNTVIDGNTVTIGNTVIGSNTVTVGSNTTISNTNVTVGNTVISNSNVTVGNTTISNTNVTVGNTVIGSNTVTVGNNTTITSNTVTVGNTVIGSNTVTVGNNTTITSNTVTVGNTVIGSNTVTIGSNTTISNTNVTVGNTVIGNSNVTVGNTVIGNSNVTVGNTVIGSNTVTIGSNTTISNTNVTVGNTIIGNSNVSVGNTVIDGNTVTVGNTVIGNSNVTVGNTVIGNSNVTVGNTVIGSNTVTIGSNTTISNTNVTVGNTVIGNSNVTVGNTVIGNSNVTVGNTVIGNSNVSVGNTVIGSNTVTVGNTVITDNDIVADEIAANVITANVITANVFVGNLTGNVTGTASKTTILETARYFSASGDASAPATSFNGSANVDLVMTLANTGVSAGTYGQNSIPVITVDSKGRLTNISTQAAANTLVIGNASGAVGNISLLTPEVLSFLSNTQQLTTTVTDLGGSNGISVSYAIKDGANVSNLNVLGALTVSGDTVVSGNFTVNGTQTIVNSTTVTIDDAIIRVNSDGAVANAGIEANIGGSIKSFVYVPSTNKWTAANGTLVAESFESNTFVLGAIANTTILFSDAGNISGNTNFTFNKASSLVHLTGVIEVNSVSFNNGASISTAAGNNNVDVTAGTGGYAGLSTSDANTTLWVEADGAYVGTNFVGSQNVWHFDTTGNVVLPRGAKIAANVGNGNVDITAGTGGYAALTSNNSNTSIWSEDNAAYVATNFTGSVNLWEFDSTGNINLPRGAKIVTNVGNSNVDITAGVNGYAALTSNDGNTTMWVEDGPNSAYIATAYNGVQHIWEFDQSGNVTLPGNLNANTHKIVNVVDPTNDQDAATKKYVDDQISNSAGSGVATGVIFQPITDYGSVSDTANVIYDFGSIANIASHSTSYQYILETRGITHDGFTVQTLPNPGVPGQIIYVSNDAYGPTMAFSDGSNWKRMTDGGNVSLYIDIQIQ